MKNFLQIATLIVLVAAIGIGVSIWQPWKTASRTIQTNGEGKVKAAPDVAQVSGGVEIKKSTANEAQTIANNTIIKIITAVKGKGVEEKDIKTENISTNPNYDYSSNKMEIDGYISRATITVTIRDITKSQGIIDLVTQNGGTNVSGPSLTFSDQKLEELKGQARDKAVTNAKEKAGQLAKASSAKVGKVVTISESSASSGGVIPYLYETTADSAKDISSTILPGESEIIVNISATFSIK